MKKMLSSVERYRKEHRYTLALAGMSAMALLLDRQASVSAKAILAQKKTS